MVVQWWVLGPVELVGYINGDAPSIHHGAPSHPSWCMHWFTLAIVIADDDLQEDLFSAILKLATRLLLSH